jgi:hypothetical protein
MVAYKDEPVMVAGKEYHKQDYTSIKLQNYTTDRHKPAGNRFSASHDTIDRILQMPANNEHYQQASEKHCPSQSDRIAPENGYSDYLSQPVWFYKIMERIEKDRRKPRKQSIQKQLYLFMN